MGNRLIEVTLSGIVIFIAGFVLWPPTDSIWQWWTVISEGPEMGLIVLIVLIGLSTATGLGLSTVGNIRPSNLIIGGILAFITGMLLINLIISPDSPSHLLLYGFILVFVFLGAAIGYAVSFTQKLYSNKRTGST